MNAGQIDQFMTMELPALCRDDVHGEAGYALPDATLALLAECVRRLGVRKVFEFGSGRSTQAFLQAGCSVTVIEDSAAWLGETIAPLAESERARFTSHLLPLQRLWLSGAPIRSWVFPEAALAALREADLILVDSPAWPPFREHALTLALAHSQQALVVADDANIPTVHRFCQRLSARNGVPAFQTTMDHGLFLMHATGTGSLDTARPILETLKAWRRYFMAGRDR